MVPGVVPRRVRRKGAAPGSNSAPLPSSAQQAGLPWPETLLTLQIAEAHDQRAP